VDFKGESGPDFVFKPDCHGSGGAFMGTGSAKLAAGFRQAGLQRRAFFRRFHKPPQAL
jgi:hypothetical protein